ncbi:MAG TPA: YdeI/OmpD-associated family protein [Lysobacter sp.]
MAQGNGPIVFEARLQRPAQPKGAPWSFLVLPAAASAQLRSRGLASVEGSFGGVAFAATLEPDGKGGHWMRLPRSLREAAGVTIGDTVALSIAPAAKEPEPRVPTDLRAALAAAPAAKAQWDTLTTVARRDFVQWLGSAKKAETRERRIATACDMLAQGKRRICCFDRSGIYGGNAGVPVAAD